jgi:hypothetical protein
VKLAFTCAHPLLAVEILMKVLNRRSIDHFRMLLSIEGELALCSQ